MRGWYCPDSVYGGAFGKPFCWDDVRFAISERAIAGRWNILWVIIMENR